MRTLFSSDENRHSYFELNASEHESHYAAPALLLKRVLALVTLLVIFIAHRIAINFTSDIHSACDGV